MLGALLHSAGSMLDGLSEQVVGWTFPPVARAFEDSPWKPEDVLANSYCRRCGDSVGPGEATDSGCSTCGEGAELDGGIGDQFVRLGPYVDPLRTWVRAVKFNHWNDMGVALGRLLGEQLVRSGTIARNSTIVVPMPMPWFRRMYRGTDHARDIASGVRASLNVALV